MRLSCKSLRFELPIRQNQHPGLCPETGCKLGNRREGHCCNMAVFPFWLWSERGLYQHYVALYAQSFYYRSVFGPNIECSNQAVLLRGQLYGQCSVFHCPAVQPKLHWAAVDQLRVQRRLWKRRRGDRICIDYRYGAGKVVGASLCELISINSSVVES